MFFGPFKVALIIPNCVDPDEIQQLFSVFAKVPV